MQKSIVLRLPNYIISFKKIARIGQNPILKSEYPGHHQLIFSRNLTRTLKVTQLKPLFHRHRSILFSKPNSLPAQIEQVARLQRLSCGWPTDWVTYRACCSWRSSGDFNCDRAPKRSEPVSRWLASRCCKLRLRDPFELFDFLMAIEQVQKKQISR